MKKFLRRFFLFLLFVLIVIQFFRPAKNIASGQQAYASDITTVHAVPDDVQVILKKACYDCHSNNTRYPWYNKIQPVAWWLAGHIKDGKQALNYSEFATYSLRKQYNRLLQTSELVKKGEMPFSSYTWIHKDAILTEAEKISLSSWTGALCDSMKAVYPADSLTRKK